MIRWNLLTKGPVLMAIFPLSGSNQYDKPVHPVLKPLIEDELGWDRVKRIFRQTEEHGLTKELQSIINVTLSGTVFGVILGGTRSTKHTVNNFISSNEATRFGNHIDAKRHLQQIVSVNFIKQGGKLGGKLGLFCFLFSTITTCATAYRGKLAIENYILGASITGALFKMNLGVRATLVGAGLGSILGGICGTASVLILHLSGISMDEVLDAQQKWITSRDESVHKKIRSSLGAEKQFTEIKQFYDENVKLRSAEQEKDSLIENRNA